MPGVPPVWCCVGVRAPTQERAESGPAQHADFVAAWNLLFSASKYTGVNGLRCSSLPDSFVQRCIKSPVAKSCLKFLHFPLSLYYEILFLSRIFNFPHSFAFLNAWACVLMTVHCSVYVYIFFIIFYCLKSKISVSY